MWVKYNKIPSSMQPTKLRVNIGYVWKKELEKELKHY